MAQGAIDQSLLSVTIAHPKIFPKLLRAGLCEDHFVDEYKTMWRYICRIHRDYHRLPPLEILQSRFPEFSYTRINSKDVPMLLQAARQRRQYMDLMHALQQAVDDADSYDEVEQTISKLQGEINSISSQNGAMHLVDIFSKSAAKRMLRSLSLRSAGIRKGIPTGLSKLDETFGGIHRGQMVTIIGRAGRYKTWLSLWMVASAVISGHKVILYPLEMSLDESAFRLYTIFSQKCFGAHRAIKNLDLIQGKVTKSKMVRFLAALEDKFAGQLYLADTGTLSDPYTVEKIEAEVLVYQPDMFWVDYLTLMRPADKKVAESWEAMKTLSSGIKLTASRRSCVGGCSAQVNREAVKTGVFLPRLEHISFGDSLGADSDIVISINKHNDWLHYAVVKNRGGPEIPRQRARFDVNIGALTEMIDEDS